MVLAPSAGTSLAGSSLLQVLLCDLAVGQEGRAGPLRIQGALLGQSGAAMQALGPSLLPLDLSGLVTHFPNPDFFPLFIGFCEHP